MKARLLILSLLSVLCCAVTLGGLLWESEPTPPHEIEGNRVLGSLEDEMWLLGFTLVGSGGGMLTDVNFLCLIMTMDIYPDENEALSLLVAATEVMKNRVNADLGVRPYLSHFPFSESGLQVILLFPNSKGSVGNCPSITAAQASEGWVWITKGNGDCAVSREPYSESLKRVGSHNWTELIRDIHSGKYRASRESLEKSSRSSGD